MTAKKRLIAAERRLSPGLLYPKGVYIIIMGA